MLDHMHVNDHIHVIVVPPEGIPPGNASAKGGITPENCISNINVIPPQAGGLRALVLEMSTCSNL